MAQAGFTEEEITEIHTRRAAGARAQYLFTDRPASPAYSATELPILALPTPLTTTISRQLSDTSLSGTTEFGSLSSPMSLAPPHHSPARSTTHHQYSVENSLNHQHNISMSTLTHTSSVDSHGSDSIVSLGQDSFLGTPGRVYSPSRLAESIRPTTPPRRTYHITNEVTSSPPPSYTNFSPNGKGTTYSSDQKTALPSDQSSTPRPSNSVGSDASPQSSDTTPQRSKTNTSHDRTASSSSSSSHSSPIPRPRAGSRVKPLMTLPPRLSLHKATDSSDLSSWSKALISGISIASEVTPSSSTFAAAQNTSAKARSPTSSKATMKQKSSQSTRPSLPNMQSIQHSDDEEDIPSSSRAEPASTARYDPSAESWDEPERPSPVSTETPSPYRNSFQGVVTVEPEKAQDTYTSAISQRNSPTLSLTPNDQDFSGRQFFLSGKQKGDAEEGLLRADDEGRQWDTSRDSSRSSTSTVMAASIVRGVSIARRAGAYVIDNSKVNSDQRKGGSAAPPRSSLPATTLITDAKHPPSPLSSTFGSEEGSPLTSGSSSFLSQDQQTPLTDAGLDSPLTYYLDSSSSPDASKLAFPPSPRHYLRLSVTDTFGNTKDDEIIVSPQEGDQRAPSTSPPTPPPPRPKIVISSASSPVLPTSATSSGTTPLTPFQRYPGWLSSVVAPLEQFIDEAIDPREYYLDLHEIAEGESGSVFASQLTKENRQKLKLPPLIKARDADDLANDRTTLVAIKSIAILPSGSPKLVDLGRELSLMKGLGYEHVLTMDAVYVDLVEDTLWIRMELMERSLADIIGLVPEGLMLQDRMIARFASDVCANDL